MVDATGSRAAAAVESDDDHDWQPDQSQSGDETDEGGAQNINCCIVNIVQIISNVFSEEDPAPLRKRVKLRYVGSPVFVSLEEADGTVAQTLNTPAPAVKGSVSRLEGMHASDDEEGPAVLVSAL